MSARKATKYEKYQQSSGDSQVFSDFDNAFLPHPFTGQITRRTNVDAVKMALRNLILTNKYERLRNPEFGGNIQKYLFENIDRSLAIDIENDIKYLIRNYEPRVRLIQVKATPDEDNNALNIRIIFATNLDVGDQEVELTLYRVR